MRYTNVELELQFKKKRVCVCVYIVWIVNHVLNVETRLVLTLK